MEEPWSAQWIGCHEDPRHPVFRTTLPHDNVKSARIYICGLGLYRAELNGEKIGDEYLTPFCSSYNAYVQSETYDITEQLKKGGCLTVTLGNGWYHGRFGFKQDPRPYYGKGLKLIAEIHIEHMDGRQEVIATDEHWQVDRSNIIFSNIYDGEQRDDTLPHAEAENAILVEAPEGKLADRISAPLRAQERFAPELLQTPAGEYVFDMKQNFAGIFQMKLHEPAGKKIHLQFGEVLQDGCFYRENLRSAKAEYIYISDGEPHVIEPFFTFYGYRYVKVEGAEHLKETDFTGIALYSEIFADSRLTTGDPLINQLIHNAEWGMKSNYLDVPTDCPQRDERMGWTGDAQVFSATAMDFSDPYAFFYKYLTDMAAEQKDNGGSVPIVVPSFGLRESAAVWGDATVIIPWNMYQYSGDSSILKEHFPSMAAWVDYIRSIDGSDHHWGSTFQFGDWLGLDGEKRTDAFKGGTDDGFIAYVYYFNSTDLTAKAARLIGREEDAEKYAALAAEIKAYILDEYYSKNGRCTADTQTGMVLSLLYGFGSRQKNIDELIRLLTMNNGRLATGFVGTPFLCTVLAEAGRPSEAYRILFNENYPGWLYEVKQGATTIWERWNSLDETGHISSTGMNSLNHYSYGSIVRFLFETAAGLQMSTPGYRTAVIRPYISMKLHSIDAERHTASGTYRVCWTVIDNDHLHVEVTVPFGCHAELYLPYIEDGRKELVSGTYSYDYQTDQPIQRILSTKDPLCDLLSDNAARSILLAEIPSIMQVPERMHTQSLHDIAGSMGTDELADKLAVLDEELTAAGRQE
jgi:alpha-L-rhamnosidase